MQFRLRSLFLITAAVAATCGVVFAAPPLVALPLLCTVLWVCPALWVNGIVYGRGPWRAFFIGGLMAGLGPHLAALYYSVLVAASLFDGDSLRSLNFAQQVSDPFPNLVIAAILLAPGLFALLGGWVGMAVYYAFEPPKAKAPQQPPASEDYLVIEGRIRPGTAVPPALGLSRQSETTTP
jgi:hypothetical protein